MESIKKLDADDEKALKHIFLFAYCQPVIADAEVWLQEWIKQVHFQEGLERDVNRFIDRQMDWLRQPSGLTELLFGWGIPGGSQAMGYSFTASVDMQMDHRINPMISIGTTHNQYLDLYQMGGIFLPMTLMGLIICANIQLLINWIQFNDQLSKIFFFLNVVFAINLFVANGVLFQPIASIPFWLSISYLLRPNKPRE